MKSINILKNALYSLFWGVIINLCGFVWRYFYYSLDTMTPVELGNMLKAEWSEHTLLTLVFAFCIMFWMTNRQLGELNSYTADRIALNHQDLEEQNRNKLNQQKITYEESVKDLLANHEKELAESLRAGKLAGKMAIVPPMARLMTGLITRYLEVSSVEIAGHPQQYEVFPDPRGGRIICFKWKKESFMVNFTAGFGPKLNFTPGSSFRLDELVPFPENETDANRIHSVFESAYDILRNMLKPDESDPKATTESLNNFLHSVEIINLTTTSASTVSPTLKPVIE